MVERAVNAGASFAGMTNCDEFGMGSATAFSVHGATFNPYSALFALLAAHGGAGVDAASLRRAPSWLTPGGSSGGSAVAVAVGAVDVALGSDTGGSVRQPAAFCGVVGFKPSYGRLPRWGLLPYACSLDTVGVLARSVDTARRVYEVCIGPDARDDTSERACSVFKETGKLDALAAGDLRGLRVGLPDEYHVAELDAATVAAWHACAHALAAAGAQVVRVSLPHTAAALPAYYVIAPAEAASNLSRYDGVRYGYRAMAARERAEGGGASSTISQPAAALHEEYTRTRSEGFGPEVRARVLTGNYVLSAAARGEYYDAACEVRKLVAADFDAVFRRSRAGSNPDAAVHGDRPQQGQLPYSGEARAYGSAPLDSGVDILLAPTSPMLPWPSRCTAERDPIDVYSSDVLTVPASLAGLPALSLPFRSAPYPRDLLQEAWRDAQELGLTRGVAAPPAHLSLPIGLQLIGRHLDEDTLLRVAAAIEAVAAWAPPTYVTGGA